MSKSDADIQLSLGRIASAVGFWGMPLPPLLAELIGLIMANTNTGY
jgi:hypothetical protein